MKELNEKSGSHQTNQGVSTIILETQFGPVELPVDEHWHEYSEEERIRIRSVIEMMLNDDALLAENFCMEAGFSARNMTQFFSLEEVKKASDGVVVMQGDWGGQIYLTCPIELVNCTEEALKKLLSKLDANEWECNEGDGATIRYGRAKPADGISGGMGGGIVKDGLWIHESIPPHLVELIREVISGIF